MTLQARVLAIVLVGAAVSAAFLRPEVASLQAQSSDPCATRGTASVTAARDTSPPRKTDPLDHDDRWSHLDSLWAHRAAVAQRRIAPLSTGSQASQDVGEVAVLQDAGD